MMTSIEPSQPVAKSCQVKEEYVMSLKLEEKALQKVLQKFNNDLGVYINDDQRYKLGRVLTIIDASIADAEQRKAIKDIIQGEWWGSNNMTRERSIEGAGMANPHTDIRAICALFGFELYPESDLAVPTKSSYEFENDMALDKFKKVALTEK